MQKTTGCFVGIDVAKDKLDVHFHRVGDAFVVGNDDEGIGFLIVILTLRAVARVVFESTGGYTRNLHRALAEAGIECHCVPPQRVRMFAKALGIEAKTDLIDAKVIALYAATAPLIARARPSAVVERLKDLVVRRQQLVGMRTQELNHRRGLVEELHAGSAQLIKTLRKNILDVDKAIEAVITNDAGLALRASAARTLKGVGPFLTATLLAFLPELGACSSKQAAALVGIAPFDDESGGRERGRHIRGGRRRLRDVLYMATRNSVRFEPLTKAIYLRLKNAGRPDKVALTAAMRKLIVIVNARVRDALKAANSKADEAKAAPALGAGLDAH